MSEQDKVNPFAPSSSNPSFNPETPFTPKSDNPFLSPAVVAGEDLKVTGHPAVGGDPPQVSPFVTPNAAMLSEKEKEERKPLTTTDHLVAKAAAENKLLAKEESSPSPRLSYDDKKKWIRKVLVVHGLRGNDLDRVVNQICELVVK